MPEPAIPEPVRPSLGEPMTDASLSHALPRADPEVLRVLGRLERELDLGPPLARLRAEQCILVTGAAGSIGRPLVALLRAAGLPVVATDLEEAIAEADVWGFQRMDVRDPMEVLRVVSRHEPSLIVHLAGAKHAPDGECNPRATADTNITGTWNILEMGRRTILASTCKAADPETAYGASKLIAERAVLNHGGSVARFYNVVQTTGNVFVTWAGIPENGPLGVTPCRRYFMTIREAVALVLWASALPSGRYTLDPGESRRMTRVARALYPGRELRPLPPRRGDRVAEPRHAAHEQLLETDLEWVEQIVSPHDPQALLDRIVPQSDWQIPTVVSSR
jgi:FlaA1/EpsC-like NDP-sugar epimerase